MKKSEMDGKVKKRKKKLLMFYGKIEKARKIKEKVL